MLITGEEIALRCDHIVFREEKFMKYGRFVNEGAKKFININDFSNIDFDNGKYVFISTDDLLFKNVLDILKCFKNEFILVCGTADFPFLPELMYVFEEVPNIKHIYSTNCCVCDERVSPIPLGFDNSLWWRTPNDLEFIGNVKDAVESNKLTKDKLAFFNFSIHTNPTERQMCHDTLVKNGFEWNDSLPYEDYIPFLARHTFCICPVGNGLDTHRFWEALALHTIPVCVHNPVASFYGQYLPVVLLNSWEELTPALLEGIQGVDWENLDTFLNVDNWNFFGRQGILEADKWELSTISNTVATNHHVQHVYSPKSPFWGIGDYLRGCLSLSELCVKLGYTFSLDYSHHPIAKYLVNLLSNSNTEVELDKVPLIHYIDADLIESTLTELPTEPKSVIPLKTNLWKFGTLSEKTIQVMRDSLIPSPELQTHIKTRFNNWGVNEKTYDAIHIRMGDAHLLKHAVDEQRYENIHLAIKAQVRSERPVIVFSDDLNLKTFLKSKGLIVSDSIPCHLSADPDEIYDKVRDTMADFFCLACAHSIYKFSMHAYGSGFVDWCSLIFGVPTYKLDVALSAESPSE
jgi:hypothetical protein